MEEVAPVLAISPLIRADITLSMLELILVAFSLSVATINASFTESLVIYQRKNLSSFSFKGALLHRTMIPRPCLHGSLPFFVGINVLMARLYNSIMVRSPSYGRQFFLGLNANLQGKPVIDDSKLYNEQPFHSILLDGNQDYLRLVLQCVCSTANLRSHRAQKKAGFDRKHIEHRHESAFWRILTRNEQCLTYIVVVSTLQLFLQLTRANATTLFLPMLLQTTGSRSNVALISTTVLLLVNTGGVFGSAFTAKHHGQVVVFMINGALITFCQVAIPLVMEVHMVLGGGGTRTPVGYTVVTFVLTCVVSGGLSWSWGSLFWTVPRKKIQTVGQVIGMGFSFGLSFVQMQYFLLMLCRLKNASIAYYAMWIWS